MQLTYIWPYLDSGAVMVSIIRISEKSPVKARGESDPLCIGTANFFSVVLLLGRHPPPGFPLTHLPLFIYRSLNIALTHFQTLSNSLPCFLLGGVYSFVFVQWEKIHAKDIFISHFGKQLAVVQQGSKEWHEGGALKPKYRYFKEYRTSKLYLGILVTQPLRVNTVSCVIFRETEQ